MIYFLASAGRIKIGYTSDLKARLQAYTTACSHDYTLIGTADGDTRVEKFIHRALAAYRRKGEWFEDCDEVHQYINKIIKREILPTEDQLGKHREKRQYVFEYEGEMLISWSPIFAELADAMHLCELLMGGVHPRRIRPALELIKLAHAKIETCHSYHGDIAAHNNAYSVAAVISSETKSRVAQMLGLHPDEAFRQTFCIIS